MHWLIDRERIERDGARRLLTALHGHFPLPLGPWLTALTQEVDIRRIGLGLGRALQATLDEQAQQQHREIEGGRWECQSLRAGLQVVRSYVAEMHRYDIQSEANRQRVRAKRAEDLAERHLAALLLMIVLLASDTACRCSKHRRQRRLRRQRSTSFAYMLDFL